MIKQKTPYKKLYCLFFISIIVNIILAFSIKNDFYKITINEEKQLIEEVINEDNIASIEYSIGYWTINKPDEVDDSTLYKFLIDNGAWYPDILLRHAKIESGNYTSNIYRNANNLFGMRKVNKRPTTQIGVYNGFGVYKNWCESALDRILWDNYHFKNKKPTKIEYLNSFKVYGEDTNYIKKLKK